MTDRTPLHELMFHVRAASQVNVNSIEPELVMAWLLHKAELTRDENNKRFLAAANEIATIYSYMEMAKRVKETINEKSSA